MPLTSKVPPFWVQYRAFGRVPGLSVFGLPRAPGRPFHAEQDAGAGAHGRSALRQSMLQFFDGLVKQRRVRLSKIVHRLQRERANDGALAGQPLANGLKGFPALLHSEWQQRQHEADVLPHFPIFKPCEQIEDEMLEGVDEARLSRGDNFESIHGSGNEHTILRFKGLEEIGKQFRVGEDLLCDRFRIAERLTSATAEAVEEHPFQPSAGRSAE